MYIGEPKIIEKNEETRVIIQLRPASKEDVNLYLNGNFLVILVKGHGSKTIKLKNRNYDTSNARATFKNGVLEVMLPLKR